MEWNRSDLLPPSPSGESGESMVELWSQWRPEFQDTYNEARFEGYYTYSVPCLIDDGQAVWIGRYDYLEQEWIQAENTARCHPGYALKFEGTVKAWCKIKERGE